MKFTFQVRELRAAALFRSGDNSRPALGCLHLEHRPCEPSVVVATDGRRMVVIGSHAEQDDVSSPESFDLDANVVETLLAVIQTETKPFQSVGIEGSKNTVSLQVGRLSISMPNDPFEFPKWRNLFEQFQTPKASTLVSVNPEFLHTFTEAAEILGADAINCTFTGEDSALKIWSSKLPNFHGLVMPLKLDGGQDRDAYPKWLKA